MGYRLTGRKLATALLPTIVPVTNVGAAPLDEMTTQEKTLREFGAEHLTQ